ncbi:KAP family P-loop NTPase fold protein [Kribbella catacumbae]|uniref:KAP family P-loop NTPase fold protein n=1 Tax=Kribbella catacumbae TaxID=460086 RepID=UPI00037BE5BA|nr:P-loop NTPase fold protein [Kribbella catacumbae]
MAEQLQVSVVIEGRLVELIHGDLFESDAECLVVPCTTSGSVSRPFSEQLGSLGISLPRTSNMAGGGVILAGRGADSGQSIYLAAVVTSPELAEDAVRMAAQNVGEIVARDGGRAAFPLLGTGATDGLPPEVSLKAIIAGFGRSGSLRIHVPDSTVYSDLIASAPQPPDSLNAPQASSKTAPPDGIATPSPDGASPSVPSPAQEELVPTHTDGPAYVDELGRQGFARVLGRRIRDARKEEARNSKQAVDPRARRGGAFIVHLHAPWGAGKTSVLNFLAAELRKADEAAGEKRSVVVEFNAWRHQRIEPPWWWLMTALYSGAVRDLDKFDKPRAVWLRLREWLWRSKGGWPGYVALLVVAGVVTWAWQAGWFGAVSNQELFSPDTVKGYLVAAAAIITPALTVWGLLHAMGRWVFTTSARGARRFMANTSDPMRTAQDHLADLTKWIHHDVVVMIDDLDRCKGPYVVELLEGIQTLFRDVPVTYVIAADRDWLADSYAAEYSGFVSVAGEPGRPVGYLFLEKTFQISTGLPRSGERLNAFWGRILRSPSVPDEQALEQARADAKRDLGGKQSDEARAEVLANPGRTPAEKLARWETVAVEMVTERAQQRNKHTLEPFGALLGRDPNPRAMKRLVNAYGIARGIETLQGFNLEDNHVREQETALWTILTLRWPKLAGHLARYPEHLEYVGTADPPSTIPADLRPLFADPELLDVVQGKGVEASLTPEILTATTLR